MASCNKLVQFHLPAGSGEFGDVYKAKWHGSYVAAKLLKRSDEIALGDFRTEIAILRKIHHPNCTQFLGACTKQKPYIVITELMACSLADAFQRTFYAPSIRRQVRVHAQAATKSSMVDVAVIGLSRAAQQYQHRSWFHKGM